MAKNIPQELRNLYSKDSTKSESHITTPPATIEDIRKVSAASVDRAPLITGVEVEGAINVELNSDKEDTLEISIREGKYRDVVLNGNLNNEEDVFDVSKGSNLQHGSDNQSRAENELVAQVDDSAIEATVFDETRNDECKSNSGQIESEDILNQNEDISREDNVFEEDKTIIIDNVIKDDAESELLNINSVANEGSIKDDEIEGTASILNKRSSTDSSEGSEKMKYVDEETSESKIYFSDSEEEGIKEIVKEEFDKDMEDKVLEDLDIVDENIITVSENISEINEPLPTLPNEDKIEIVVKDCEVVEEVNSTDGIDIIYSDSISKDDETTTAEVPSLDESKDCSDSESVGMSASYDITLDEAKNCDEVTATYDVVPKTEVDVSVVLSEVKSSSVEVESEIDDNLVVDKESTPENEIEGDGDEDDTGSSIEEATDNTNHINTNDNIEIEVDNTDLCQQIDNNDISVDNSTNLNVEILESKIVNEDILEDVIDLEKVNNLVDSIIDDGVATFTSELLEDGSSIEEDTDNTNHINTNDNIEIEVDNTDLCQQIDNNDISVDNSTNLNVEILESKIVNEDILEDVIDLEKVNNLVDSIIDDGVATFTSELLEDDIEDKCLGGTKDNVTEPESEDNEIHCEIAINISDVEEKEEVNASYEHNANTSIVESDKVNEDDNTNDNVLGDDELTGADVPRRKLSMAEIEVIGSEPETAKTDIAAEEFRLPEISEIRVDQDSKVDQEVRVEQIDFTQQDEGNLSLSASRHSLESL